MFSCRSWIDGAIGTLSGKDRSAAADSQVIEVREILTIPEEQAAVHGGSGFPVMARPVNASAQESSGQPEAEAERTNQDNGMEQESASSPFGDDDTAADNGSRADTPLGTPREIDDIRKAAEAFNAAFNELLNESIITRRQLDERAGRIAELDDTLRQTSHALREEADRYGQLERAAAEQADALRQDLQQAGAERARLQEQAETLQQTLATRDEELSAQAARLEQTGAELAGLAEASQAEREAHARELAELGEQLEARRQELDALHGELEELRRGERAAAAQADALSQELQAADAERARLQEQGETLQQALAERDTELSAQAERLEQTSAELAGLIETSQAEREAHAYERAELGEQLDARRQELDALHGDLDALRARIAGLEQDLHAAVTSRDEAVNTLESTSEAYRELEAHATNLENLNNALHDSSVSEQNRSRKVLQLRDAEIQALRRRLEQSGQTQDDTGQLQEELQQLQVRLADTEHELHALEGTRAALQRAEQELAARAEQEPAAVLEHEELLQMQDDIGTLRQQVTDMDVLRTSLGATQAENVDLRSELQAAQEQLGGAHELQQQMEALQVENAGLQQQLAVSEQALAEMLRPAPVADTSGDGEPAGADGMITSQPEASPASVDVAQPSLPADGESVNVPQPGVDASVDNAPESTGSAFTTGHAGASSATPEQTRAASAGMHPAVFGNEAEIVCSVLRDNRLKDLYQPISTLRGDTSGFYEVLVRVTGEDGNAITPADFFAMAQRCGKSYEVDCQIIESALKELARDQSGTVTLFIKLSPDTVANEELGMRVLKLVKQYKASPVRLVFEVTENNLRMDLKSVSSLTRALHSIGCKVAVEHYTHSTEVQHLKHIHADFLKIDASLVHEIGEDESKLSRIREIVDIARGLGCKTIAEQVESPYSLTRLWSLGVDYAQGYFIQEPGAERGYDFDGNGPAGKPGDSGKAIFHF
jgi:EAL domain-containing protein (putative c-di-GMP-specific phosphodiesterase class I)/predicted  nucleic acid-binding Zn-ribbon protein